MDRKKIQKTKYLAVFATTTLIFFIGIIIGGYFSNLKIEKIYDIENDLKINILGTEIQYQIIAKDPCKFVNSTPLIEELHEMGTKLDYMENALGKDNKEVLNLKEYYSILEIRQWLLEKDMMQKCGSKRTLVLYFYSNDKHQCPECEEQGYVLTYARKNFDNINIYSFDIDTKNPAVDTVKRIYGVTIAPTVIINEKKQEGFVTKDQIVNIILEQMSSFANSTKE